MLTAAGTAVVDRAATAQVPRRRGVLQASGQHLAVGGRGNHPLLEFGPDGAFVRSIGDGSTIFHAAHSVRFDVEDNMWLVDAGNNVVVKFNPKGRIVQALGRRLEPWVYMTHGIERAIPSPAAFYQPTDTVVGPDGSTYVTDGYGNSRVAKFSREGNLMEWCWSRSDGPWCLVLGSQSVLGPFLVPSPSSTGASAPGTMDPGRTKHEEPRAKDQDYSEVEAALWHSSVAT